MPPAHQRTAYDALSRLTSSTDGRGKQTTYQYDAAGNMISTTDALGKKTRYYYDAGGRLAYTVNALGEVTGTTWNNLGQKSACTEYGTRIAATTLAGMNGGLLDATASGVFAKLANTTVDGTTTYTYSADGTLSGMKDAIGNVTLYGYDSFGEQTSVSVPMANGNSLTSFAYDRRGLQIKRTVDPNGLNLAVGSQYDAFGRVTCSTDARAGARQFSYDRLGRQVQIQDATGGASSTMYDAFSRVLTQTDVRHQFPVAGRGARQRLHPGEQFRRRPHDQL